MSSKIDEFSSIFRSADKPQFEFSPPRVEKVMLISGFEGILGEKFETRIRSFVESANPHERIQWEVSHGRRPGNRQEFLHQIEECEVDMVVIQRNLFDEIVDPRYGLGVYVELLTQELSIPVLVVPKPVSEYFEKATDKLEDVILVSDHVTGDHNLVNWAIHFVHDSGTLTIAHVEPRLMFERYMEAISKISVIDTDLAEQEIKKELLKEAKDYIDRCRGVLIKKKPDLHVKEHVVFGHQVETYKKILGDHDYKLLVINSKDEKQIAMRGLAYSLAVEFSSMAMLLL